MAAVSSPCGQLTSATGRGCRNRYHAASCSGEKPRFVPCEGLGHTLTRPVGLSGNASSSREATCSPHRVTMLGGVSDLGGDGRGDSPHMGRWEF
jgi:hypothetical protein